jgi:hypothetical protein
LCPGVATADSFDEIFGDASAGNARTTKLQGLPREEARIDLIPATHAAPAHAVVVVKEALYGAYSTLIVKEDTSKKLLRGERERVRRELVFFNRVIAC